MVVPYPSPLWYLVMTFDDMRRYYRTPQWQDFKERVFRRDGYRCQACLQADATQVHHLTYDNWRNERMWQLVAVCLPCHERITEEDRASRGAGNRAGDSLKE